MALPPGTALKHLASLAKPPGSLGDLEDWAATACEVQGTLTPSMESYALVVFCADHGVKKEDQALSPFPPVVTQAVFRALAAGLSATATLARAAGAKLTVVDCGIDGDVSDVATTAAAVEDEAGGGGNCAQGADGGDGVLRSHISVVHAKVACGTQNLLAGPAMTDSQLSEALALGASCLASHARDHGAKAVGIGEVGIGNTTVAAALLAALTGASASDCCGRGTGLDESGLAHKVETVRKACECHHPAYSSVEGEAAKARLVLKHLGGLEIAAMVGAYIEAPQSKVVVVVDGFISAVAALCAARMAPACRRNMVFATALEEEPQAPAGGRILSAALGNPRPALSMRLCLGEASGAALAMPILRAAVKMVSSMGTLGEVMQLLPSDSGT